MATQIPRTLTIEGQQGYFNFDSGMSGGTLYGYDIALITSSTSFTYGHLNSSALAILFPNTTAHPVKADYSLEYGRPVYLLSTTISYQLVFDSTTVASSSGTSTENYITGSSKTDSAILSSTMSSDIKIGLKTSRSACQAISGCEGWPSTITLYFTRYDFSAVAGDNISSASVSSSTGYDGDTITYSCVPVSGATFLGWYNGSTLVSSSQTYTHTVNGADLTLTAKASAPTTKTLSATYNGAQLSGFPLSVSGDTAISYNGSTIATVPFSGGTKTLNCAGKVMSGNVALAGKTLNCSGNVMATNIVATIS